MPLSDYKGIVLPGKKRKLRGRKPEAPLRLRVGGVYEMADGRRAYCTSLVIGSDDRFICLNRHGDGLGTFNPDGTSRTSPYLNIIREVSAPRKKPARKRKPKAAKPVMAWAVLNSQGQPIARTVDPIRKNVRREWGPYMSKHERIARVYVVAVEVRR